MKVVIRLTKRVELRALPILLRHTPGSALPNQTYIISAEAALALRSQGVVFTELSHDSVPNGLEGAGLGERI